LLLEHRLEYAQQVQIDLIEIRHIYTVHIIYEFDG